MEYRRLGASGVKVSEIGLGSWLTYGVGVDAEVARRCVAAALDLGVTFFDTANAYGRGAAEQVVGEALAGQDRSSYVLATKVFFPMGDGPNDRGLSRKHVFEQCHASLRRLGTDYIDLYQCHRYDDETPLDETLRVLDDLVRQGKVLYVGVSGWSAEQIADALAVADDLGLDRLVANQPEYSILERRIEDEVLPLCDREGVGQVVWSPLAQGVLTGKYRKGEPPPPGSRAASRRMGMFVGRFLVDEVLDAVERLRAIADEAGMTLAQLALAWVLRQPGVASAIVGASRPEQLAENCAAAGRRLDADELAAIDKAVAEVLAA
ncbi:MAG TPA: aldo/keto reductase family protein [Actinomycetes bacterium]|nr:aldo/keto reductase family protein [Actinomycetes bacterium]